MGQKALTTKLLGLVVVIVLIALIGLFIQIFTAGGSGLKDYQRSVKLSQDVNNVHANLYKIKSMVAASQDKQEITKISDQQITLLNDSINTAKKALESNISAEQKKFYQAITDNLSEYQQSAAQVIRLAPVGSGSAYLSSANEKMDAINQLFTQLFDMESSLAEKGGSSLISYIIIVVLIVLLIVCVIIIPSSIKQMMASNVIEPLQETSGVLREFASGKYNRSLTWDADDAIGELVQSVNALRSKMSSPATAQKAAHEAAPAMKAAAPEPAATASDDKTRSLSDMIKKTSDKTQEGEKLVTSSKKAIDKLQDI